MIGTLTAGTRLVALLGNPVHHSLSPVFQNAAFGAAGVDGVYLALRCDSSAVPGLLRGIAGAGGAGNVTVPHKELAAGVVDRRTTAAERTGACNTYWYEGGEVWGDNTDAQGCLHAVTDLLGQPPRGARVLLLGAGGAARAALCALADAGASEVVLLNRTVEQARLLAERFGASGAHLRVARERAEVRGERFDLVINSTSLGLRDDDPLPLHPDEAAGIGAALDLVYRPQETRWVRELRSHNMVAADGLGMLVHQGAAAFERWWQCPAPLAVMRNALPLRSPHGLSEMDPPAA